MLNNSFNGWIGLSPIETLIQRACEPSLGEPPYNLHIELAEYVNSKKANTPREAAHAILRLVNSRNPHVSLLALSLLNTLVQQCGYPFHLQVSTKEFLNELVKRFPERPPPYPGPVMGRILELINDWKEGICVESRWKDDLGNIRDMWRLLSFKGYRFKDRRRESSVPSTSALKSAEELENEDRTAQEAKLQELIRRGTPRDLAAAQDLMKVLAGANPDSKPNYKAQALLELSKLESKVILMNELLDNVKTEEGGEKFAKGDVYDQVSQILINARPKIQKWISDANSSTESGGDGDPESLDTFLQINDQINTVLTRYEAFKKGDYSATGPIPAELISNSAASGRTSQKSDLIDLDLNFTSSNAGLPTTGSRSAQDDLMELFSSSGQVQPQHAVSATATKAPIDLSKLYSSTPSSNLNPSHASPLFNPSFSTSTSPHSTKFASAGGPQMGGAIVLPSTPTPPTRSPAPPSSIFGNGNGLGGVGNSAVGQTSTQVQGQNQAPKGKDPFAELAGLF